MAISDVVKKLGLVRNDNPEFLAYQKSIKAVGNKFLISPVYSCHVLLDELERLNYYHVIYRFTYEAVAKDIDLFTSFYGAPEQKYIFIPAYLYESKYKDRWGDGIKLQLMPSLSFRSFNLSSRQIIKLGLDVKHGGVTRSLVRSEILSSLLVSDLLQFWNCGNDLIQVHIESYGCKLKSQVVEGNLWRESPADTSNYESFATFYMKYLEEHKNSNEQLLLFIGSFIKDIGEICEYFYSMGIALEIHAQNLMCNRYMLSKKLDITPKYLYRDNGHLGLLKNDKYKEILDFYNLKYFFGVSFDDNLIEKNLWRCVRVLLFGFIGYHSDKYLVANDSCFNIYHFMEQKIKETFLKAYV